jgi:Cellulose binding domain
MWRTQRMIHTRPTTTRLNKRFIGISLALGALTLGALLPAVKAASAAAEPAVYVDALGSGWQDWSWSATNNPASSTTVQSGRFAMSVQITGAYGALSLRTQEPVDLTPGSALSLWIHGGPTGATLTLFTGIDDANSQISPGVTLRTTANTWTQHVVTAAQLNNPTKVARLTLQSDAPVAFSVDDIRWEIALPVTTQPATTQPVTTQPVTTQPASFDGSVSLDATSPGIAFTSRMWGTNIQFYGGPTGFADTNLRDRARGMTGLTRYPGTQDSQRWGWASCQMGTDLPKAIGCTQPNFTWTARPSDFIAFVRATGTEPLVTVNINATAQENAAFVAFMNGAVGDTRSIGVDQRGADWKTVGYWAQQRSTFGSPQPLNVKLWEFGNETFGGLPGPAKCTSFGWEVTWTCDAIELLNGIGTGATRQDGYRATKALMKSIDASIQVGFPADAQLDNYSGWTRDALANERGDIDFLVVHPYFRWIPPADTPAGNAEILAFPQSHWKAISTELNNGFTQYASGRKIPLVISEYNLTPGPQNDPGKRMNGQGNAIMMADSVGAMNQLGGYMAATAFDLYGAPDYTGTYFSMIRRDSSYARNPLYWGWVLWSRFGTAMLPTQSTYDASSTLSVYGGRRDANTVTLYVMNKSAQTRSTQITVNGVPGITRIVADSSVGTSMYDSAPVFNGQVNPSVDLASAPGIVSDVGGSRSFVKEFAPWSMTLLTMTVGNSPPVTTLPVTTQPATTLPITTQPATTLPITTQPATTQPVTTLPVTTLPITTLPITTLPITTQPATTLPITTLPVTTLPITTLPITTLPVTTLPVTTTPSGVTCRVTATTAWQSTGGFGSDLVVTNTSSTPISGWTLTFSFAGNQRIDLLWGGLLTQTAQSVAITDVGWNRSIAPGQSASLGYRALFSGTNSPVARYALNGQTCT